MILFVHAMFTMPTQNQFAISEVGICSVKNMFNILIKNVVDFSVEWFLFNGFGLLYRG